jgi:hypothetical protein
MTKGEPARSVARDYYGGIEWPSSRDAQRSVRTISRDNAKKVGTCGEDSQRALLRGDASECCSVTADTTARALDQHDI